MDGAGKLLLCHPVLLRRELFGQGAMNGLTYKQAELHTPLFILSRSVVSVQPFSILQEVLHGKNSRFASHVNVKLLYLPPKTGCRILQFLYGEGGLLP